MAILFKVPPQDIDGDWFDLVAPAYGAVDPQPGDKVFLWWSEAQQGMGLVGYGYCVSAWRSGRDVVARIEPVFTNYSGFGKSKLAPFRNLVGSGPEISLAAKLYRHALNKVVTLNREEEAFLDGILAPL